MDDPSDWEFSPLKELDALLRCPICFEYFETAIMLPSCSHNYCSLCIRRFLANKSQCPTCNQPVSEEDFKCNRLLDQLVHSFKANRKHLLALSQLRNLETQKGSCDPSTNSNHSNGHHSEKELTQKMTLSDRLKVSRVRNGGTKGKGRGVGMNGFTAAPKDTPHPSTSLKGTPLKGTPGPSTPLKGTPLKGTPGPSASLKGTPLKGTPGPSTPLKGTPLKGTPGPSASLKGTPLKGTPGPSTPLKGTPGPSTPLKGTPGPSASLEGTPGAYASPKGTPGPSAPPKGTSVPLSPRGILCSSLGAIQSPCPSASSGSRDIEVASPRFCVPEPPPPLSQDVDFESQEFDAVRFGDDTTMHTSKSPSTPPPSFAMPSLGSATPPIKSVATPSLDSATPPATPPIKSVAVPSLGSAIPPATPPLRSVAMPSLGTATPPLKSVAMPPVPLAQKKVTHHSDRDSRDRNEVSGVVIHHPMISGSEELSSPSTLMGRLDPAPVSTTSGSNSIVACPVCGAKTQERLINSHLDQCLSGFNSTDSPPPASSPGLPLHQPLSSTSPAPLPHAIIYEKSKTLPKLPKFVFSIMSDKQLRKKLKDYHLSPHGNRGFLMARLKEFTLRYKAEYDSLHPKTVKEIAEDVEMAEKLKTATRNLKKHDLNTSMFQGKNSDNEAERKKYENTYRDDFESLITNMKGREEKNVGSHGNVTMVTPPPGGASGNQGSRGAREEEMDGILAGDTPETQRYCFGEEERSNDGDDCSTIPESPTKSTLSPQARLRSRKRVSTSDPSSPPPSNLNAGVATKHFLDDARQSDDINWTPYRTRKKVKR